MGSQTFQEFALDFVPDIEMASSRRFDLIFDDKGLYVDITLTSDDKTVLSDIYVLDVSAFMGGVRRSLVHAVMGINEVAAQNSNFMVTIDSRNYLVLSGYCQLADLSSESFDRELTFWLDQADRLRSLAQTISFQSEDIGYELDTVAGGL